MNATGRALVLTGILLLSGCFGGARIISSFGDFRGPEGYPRADGVHNGIDIAGFVGEPVLASADGTVVLSGYSGGACGTSIMIKHHGPFRTVYCHLQAVHAEVGDEVRRGAIIGDLGTSGRAPGPGYEHVHLTLTNDGSPVDPMTVMDGCFDPLKSYPTDRFVLTYPVKCKN